MLAISHEHEDGEKNGVLPVQTLRNNIMGSTLMATTSILFGCGMGAMISSTYSIKRPLNDTAFGSQGDFILAIKYLLVLMFSLSSFLCHSLSICCKCEVGSLIATPVKSHELASLISTDHVSKVLERGFFFNIVGNRAFYGGFPLLLWVIGPLPIFLGSSLLVLALYSTDFVPFGMVSRNRDHETREREECLE